MLPSAFLWALALALASTCLAAESLYKTLGGLSLSSEFGEVLMNSWKGRFRG
jgi:hypothetical protein